MKRHWILALTLMGTFTLGGLALAQEESKNEDKKEGQKGEFTVKPTGKIIMVGPDGKVTEKTIGEGANFEGKHVTVTLSRVDGGEERQIVLVTPDGEKKRVTMQKVDVEKSEKTDGDGKKVIRVEAKVIADGKGEQKAIIIGDGKTFDVKGVGIDVEKIKALIEENKGDVKPEQILALLKSAEGKPLGGAMKLQVKKVDGEEDVIVMGVEGASAETKVFKAKSAGGDINAKLDKILERLEKLEERISKMEEKD